MTTIAIVGGGPSGLITAYFLEKKFNNSCQTTLFEASDRTGGKIVTAQFDSAPVNYEAGVAEFYSYQEVGPDPLLGLIESLGLKTVPMDGQTVVMDGQILTNKESIKRHCGENTVQAIEEFRRQATAALSPDNWYEGNWYDDNRHQWARRSCEELLNQVGDAKARKYLKIAAHSDLATEPHLTNGLNGLKNFLMDVPGYIDLYSVEGGMENMARRLREQLTETSIEFNSPVTRIEKNKEGTYRVYYRQNRQTEHRDFDAVVVSLPHNWLSAIEWGDDALRRAMTRHIAYYDRPAHYLRVSMLFKTPFWRKSIKGSWFMHDAFGGCCVYDEGTRHDAGEYGVLGWLIAGTNALSMSSFDDRTLAAKVLDSLPDALYKLAAEQFIEAKVHRWMASVNAQPGGFPQQNTRAAHLPEPIEHPGLFVVGDYLFDSTINGVLDSADFATDLLCSRLLKQKLLVDSAKNATAKLSFNGNGHAKISEAIDKAVENVPLGENPPEFASPSDNFQFLSKKSRINRNHFDFYHENSPYRNSYNRYFNAKQVSEAIKIVWKASPPYRLLDAGSASGMTLADFAECGIDAWGIEKNKYIYRQTSAEWRAHNQLGDVRKLPFPDNYFDFVYETSLAYLPENQLGRAIRELYRVTKRGVIFAGFSSDMNPQLFKNGSVLAGLKTLMSLWEWSEIFMENGFKIKVGDEKMLARLWNCEQKYYGETARYPDIESLRYCYYAKATD